LRLGGKKLFHSLRTSPVPISPASPGWTASAAAPSTSTATSLSPGPREEQVAIQLSHNAIEGRDDPVILKELWDEIEQIDLKIYAGPDSEIIKELNKTEFLSIVEARPDFKQVNLLFLPEETDQIRQILEDIDMICSGDQNYLLSRTRFNDVFRLLVEVKEKYNIINNPTAFMKIVELARERLGEGVGD
jgi:hypothetical protein